MNRSKLRNLNSELQNQKISFSGSSSTLDDRKTLAILRDKIPWQNRLIITTKPVSTLNLNAQSLEECYDDLISSWQTLSIWRSDACKTPIEKWSRLASCRLSRFSVNSIRNSGRRRTFSDRVQNPEVRSEEYVVFELIFWSWRYGQLWEIMTF